MPKLLRIFLMGMLISFWSGSNKVSYFVSLGIYALLLLPAELPGDTIESVGQFLQWINPMAATSARAAMTDMGATRHDNPGTATYMTFLLFVGRVTALEHASGN